LVDDLNPNASGKAVKASSEKVSVKFVDSPIRNLRSFTGINTICINISCINARRQSLSIDSSLSKDDKNIIFKMALFCVALHKYSHAQLRQVRYRIIFFFFRLRIINETIVFIEFTY